MSRYKVKKYFEWKDWVTPKLLYDKPRHRWFVFPHSFTDELVACLVDEWDLDGTSLLIDPFVGAGTSILAAKQKGIPAKGFDLSPLAVLTSNIKIANYHNKRLKELWKQLKPQLRTCELNGEAELYPEVIQKALPGRKLATFHYFKEAIMNLRCSKREKEFFMLALLTMLPNYSNAIATGGWLSWKPNHRNLKSIISDYENLLTSMFDDIESTKLPRTSLWNNEVADARRLPLPSKSCDAVITSPPYPNRHDYTRVFTIELMFGLLDWEQTRDLRYQTFESHPEARPVRPSYSDYAEPRFIKRSINQIQELAEEKVVSMLHGYFIDLYLNIREVSRILKPGGFAAYVVGNAQYNGIPVEVDRATAAIAEQCGLKCEEIRVARIRGNSAQQMKVFGRNPSRESVVLLKRS